MDSQTHIASTDGYPTVMQVDGLKMLRVEINMRGRKVDDVIVRPVDDYIMVLDKSDCVLRNIALPESVDPFTVEALMTGDGILCVQAPLMC